MKFGIETETLEFKQSTAELDAAINSISAMLNKHQAGEIYFGIKPNGDVVGQIVTEQTLRDISQKIGSMIEPRIFPEINRVVIDGKECVHVKFEGDHTPYFARGVAKIRVADEDLTMTPQELANYIRDNASEGNQWENYTSNKLVDDADEKLLRQYVEKAKAAGRISFDYTDKATVLKKLGLSDVDHLTNAGKVLFADDIVQDVQMAIFATNERVTFIDIQRVHGPIIRLVDAAEKYIMNNIHWRVEFDGSIQRKEIPEIPADAVREALLNSFCHKDHGSGQSNEVAIFKDRIEIYNPGQFPKGYTPKDFIEHSERPIRRNPVIARTLYYSKDVESFGSGLKRIHDACTSASVKYDFNQLKSGFVVIFYRSTEAGNTDIGSGKTPISADITPISADIIEKILAYIAKNGSITNAEAQTILGLKATRTKEILGSLVQQMILDRIGKNKGTKYIRHGTFANEVEV
ncbi:MAG: putative DNA binding domain-containing protein [Clostridia bacterium]|nr:putative DNA binding domain-containing protein [Clostridia bacterium]